MQSGELRDRMSFGTLSSSDGDGGNFRSGPYVPQFDVAANIKPLNGGEEVMAGRLNGTRTILVTVRSSEDTRSITSEWSAKNVRTSEIFDIIEAKDPDSKRQWVEILMRSGVSGGGVPGEQQ